MLTADVKSCWRNAQQVSDSKDRDIPSEFRMAKIKSQARLEKETRGLDDPNQKKTRPRFTAGLSERNETAEEIITTSVDVQKVIDKST